MKKEALRKLVSPLSGEEAVREKLAAHLEELFSSLAPEKMGEEYRAALRTENAPAAVRGWLPPVRVRSMALPVRLPAQPQRMSLSALPALSPPMTQFLDADLGRDFWTRPLKRSLTSVGASCRPQGLAKGKGGCLRLREGALSVEPGGKPAAAAAVMPGRLGHASAVWASPRLKPGPARGPT